MLITLIGIQTVCVMTATTYVLTHFKPKFTKLKLHSNTNGYKIFKTF